MQRRHPGPIIAILALVMALLLPATARAHFDLSAGKRVIVIAREDSAIRLYMRISGPLLYAGALAAHGDDTTAPLVAPFLDAATGEANAALFDPAAIAADPEGFAAFVASGYAFAVDGRAVDGAPVRAVVQRDLDVLPFASAADADAAASMAEAEPAGTIPVGEAMVDVEILLDNVDGAGSLSIASTLPPIPLAEGSSVSNHIIDTLDDGTARILTVPGPLETPVVLNRSLPAAVKTFVIQGIHHILEGPDHVLFVLCLVAAARSVSVLLWEVTGFTIGHSVTLIAGFLGFVPAAPWFTPAIETAIALSIIFVAVLALRPGRQRHMVLITGAFGLLHGFGFSFVLHDILGPDAPNLIPALLSFNLGVEIGQLMIVIPAFLLLALLHRVSGRLDNWARYGAAAVAIAVSVVWVVERVDLVRIAVETGA